MFVQSKRNERFKTISILLGSWDFHLAKDDLRAVEYFTGEKLYSRMPLTMNLKMNYNLFWLNHSAVALQPDT